MVEKSLEERVAERSTDAALALIAIEITTLQSLVAKAFTRVTMLEEQMSRIHPPIEE